MKIITFNTFCAPIMFNRKRRKLELLKQICKWSNDGVDIICLQELNSYRTGIITYLLNKLDIMNPYIQFIIDIFGIFEGLLFPIFVLKLFLMLVVINT